MSKFFPKPYKHFKKTVYEKLILKNNNIDAEIPNNGGLVLETKMLQRSRVLRRGLNMFTKRYLILVN